MDEVEIREVVYCVHGGRTLQATIYMPLGKGPNPSVVEMHGGRWVANDRFTNARIARYLASRGTLVMSIDFRMPPEAGYPAPLVDLLAAKSWLDSHAEDLDVDRQRIGAIGTSSGGHLVLLAAIQPLNPKFFAGSPPDAEAAGAFAFVVACWPIVDPMQRYAMARQNGRADLVAGHDAFWESEARMTEGSPQRILASAAHTHTPPLLIIQGTSDDNVDHRTIEPFASLYRQRGGSAEVHEFEGAGHAFITRDSDGPDAIRALHLIDAFIADGSAGQAQRRG